MSEPVPPAPETSDVTFRIITPVFGHRIEGADRFTHSGRLGASSFEITLLPYQAFGTEVLPSYDQEMVDCLQENQVHFWEDFPFPATHFLLTDVTHCHLSNTTTAQDPRSILPAALDALRLHSSCGLAWHYTYVFARPKSIFVSRMGTTCPGTRQMLLRRHLGPDSALYADDFAACQNTIGTLRQKTWSDAITFDRVLRLAMEYHRLAFTLERVEHAFLILMVAFEAMFKKEAEDNASKAALRIGRLLGATKRGCQAIQKEFNDDPVDSFCKIRNRIAHGDPNMNLATVASKYPSLYRHVTAGIVTLLNLPAGSLDETKDYYDEISRYTKARYDGLPRG